jgi:hypothetical protein
MFGRTSRDVSGSAGSKADPRSSEATPGKSTLAMAVPAQGGPAAIQRKEAPAPVPAYEKAEVAGPNKNKTINWDDPPELYGIAGADKATLRGLYQQHLREHMSKEPRMLELGSQALLPGEIGARIEAISDGSKPLWVGAVEHKGPEAATPYREALWRCSQRAIVDTVSSTTSDARYKKDKVPVMKDGKPVLENGKPKMMDQTYCNVYGADMVNALGGYLPRVWYNEDLTSATKLPAEKLQKLPKIELSANLIGGWLTKWGKDYGWKPTADAQAAQAAANSGRVVIIQATNTAGSGHVNLVLAEGAGHKHTTDAGGGFQPLQSQAGVNNFKYSDTTAAGEGIGDSWWAKPEMKQGPEGHFWIYQGAAQDTAVAGATEMGGKFG